MKRPAVRRFMPTPALSRPQRPRSLEKFVQLTPLPSCSNLSPEMPAQNRVWSAAQVDASCCSQLAARCWTESIDLGAERFRSEVTAEPAPPARRIRFRRACHPGNIAEPPSAACCTFARSPASPIPLAEAGDRSTSAIVAQTAWTRSDVADSSVAFAVCEASAFTRPIADCLPRDVVDQRHDFADLFARRQALTPSLRSLSVDRSLLPTTAVAWASCRPISEIDADSCSAAATSLDRYSRPARRPSRPRSALTCHDRDIDCGRRLHLG